MPTRSPGPPGSTIPVAEPANPPPRVVPAADGGPAADPPFVVTREDVTRWSTSLAVHGVLLVALALWVYSPKASTGRVFDTRLAGSQAGVDEGLTVAGGLNTAFDTGPAPETTPYPALTGMSALDVSSIEARLSVTVAAVKPSAKGGLDNPNPGAGAGDGFGLARFGDGGENIRGVAVKVGDPQFTLLWDSEVDLDLHVIEPGGKEIYWEEPRGRFGGELDVDNTKGYGPENVYWLRQDASTGEKVLGPGPAGEYRWFVVYWGGFGGVPKPTRWKVRVKHAGKVDVVSGRFTSLNERSKPHTLKVDGPAPVTAGETPAK